MRLPNTGRCAAIRIIAVALAVNFSLAAWGQAAETDDPVLKARIAAVNALSISRLKLLGAALKLYMLDHDERLPPMRTPEATYSLLLPYYKDADVTKHPVTGELYHTNSSLSSKTLGSVQNPGGVAAFFEPRPAPDGTRGIAYLDGNAGRVPESRWRQQQAAMGIPAAADPETKPWEAPGQTAGARDLTTAESSALLNRKLREAARSISVDSVVSDAVVTRLGQEALCLRGFASHFGHYPEMTSPAALRNSLRFSDDPNAYVHPLSGKPFVPNPKLSGLPVQAVDHTEITVALYEPAPAPDGKRAVAFANGSVRRITEPEWVALRQKGAIPQAAPADLLPPPAPAGSAVPRTPQATGMAAVFRPSRLTAQNLLSISNLKELAIGVLNYVSDHDERLPPAKEADSLRIAISQYVKRDEYFLDATTRLPYWPNAKLAGTVQTQLEAPSETILLFEGGPHEAVITGGPQTRAVAYADSHVARLPEYIFQGICRQKGIPVPELVPAPVAAPAKVAASLTDPEALAREGAVLLRNGKLLEAADILERAVKGCRESGSGSASLLRDVLGAAALANGQLGSFRRAAQEFEELEALVEKSSPAHTMDLALVMPFASALMGDGEYGKAELLLQKRLALLQAEARDPRASEDAILFEPLVGLDLAGVYLEEGRFAEVEPLLKQAETFPLYKLVTTEATRASRMAGDGPEVVAMLSSYCQVLMPLYSLKTLLYRSTGREQEVNEIDRITAPMIKLDKAAELRTAITSGDASENRALLESYRALFQALDSYSADGGMAGLLQGLNNFNARSGLDSPFIRLAGRLGLAEAYESAGRFADALPLANSARDDASAVAGEASPLGASALLLSATAEAGLSHYDRAEPLYRNAIEILARGDAAQTPLLPEARVRLAALFAASGQVQRALPVVDQALTDQQKGIRRFFALSSETAMQDYLATLGTGMDLLYTLAVGETGGSEDARPVPQKAEELANAQRQALEWTLRRKGSVLDTLVRLRQAQQTLSGDPALERDAARLRQERQRLADRELSPKAQGADRTARERDDAALRESVDLLEKALNSRLSANSPLQQADNVNLEDVRSKLPANVALLEFARFRLFDAKLAGSQAASGEAHYAAFVLQADRSVPPRAFDLGPARKIDDAVKALRAELARGDRGIVPVPVAGVSSEEKYRAAAGPLYALVFAPVREALGGAATLYVAPDGELNRVPFEALTDPSGGYLVEKYRFAYLSSGRDLLRSAAELGKGAYVFSWPEYDLGVAVRAKNAPAALARLDGAATRSAARSRSLRDVRWQPLAGAKVEGEQVELELAGSAFAPVKRFSGPDALEEVFKAIRSPRLLHVATHGFFLEDLPAGVPPAHSSPGAGADPQDPFQSALAAVQQSMHGTENPLLRSGIVLAGANAPPESAAGRVDDGYVTAEEVSQMNLRGADLVVLSACETGLGDVKVGEGVYGLRRAFLLAGARSLLTSLFSIPDTETVKLMHGFYAALTGGKLSKLEALRQAELSLIRERREAKQSAHPYYWAGFILVGDPG